MRRTLFCRRRAGITILEVVLAIAAVVVMVVSLVPALSRARAVAGSATDQSNLAMIHNALTAYADDNLGYTPTTCPTDAGDWYPDFNWNYPLNANVSSNGIWGIRSCAIPNVTQGWPPNPANPNHYNEALGLGVLVQGTYTTLETMYVPSTRFDAFESEEDGFPFWSRRSQFGKPLVYWTESGTPDYDGRGWLSANGTGTYGAGTNYLLMSTYSYRGGDWTSEIRYDSGTSGGNPAGGLWRNKSPSAGPVFSKPDYCKPSYPGYNNRAIVIDYRGYLHAPLTGGNVLFGDGAVVFWDDPGSWRAYTTNGFGPYDQWAGFGFHGGFATYLFMNADQEAR